MPKEFNLGLAEVLLGLDEPTTMTKPTKSDLPKILQPGMTIRLLTGTLCTLTKARRVYIIGKPKKEEKEI